MSERWAPGVADVFAVAQRTLAMAGEWWEVGVHKGTSSVRFAQLVADSTQPRSLRLFDSFTGHPPIGPQDDRSPGSTFANTSPELVRARLAAAKVKGQESFISIHKGMVPESFAGLEESRIAFAYIDLDLYAGTRGALEFVLPRLVPGGRLVVDDYSAKGAWPGVSMAADEILPSVQRVGKRAVLYERAA